MPQRSSSPPTKPALHTELLLNLAFLAATALLLGGGTILLVSLLAPDLSPNRLFAVVLVLVVLDVGVFLVFGSYLVRRHVLRPLKRLTLAADAVTAGDLRARAPEGEAHTRDFAVLGERLNRMTDHLLDAQGYVVRAEKLASVGRLAAGIAHEVGNPLGAMGTYVEVLRRRGADPDVTQGITREIERIDRIVRTLLDYARTHNEALQPVAAAAVVSGVFELLQAQGVLRRVRARLDVGAGVPQVLGRAHALEQAIVNLVLNAADAAPDAEVVLGARRWAYEPGRASPRRESDAEWTLFPRSTDRRPTRPDFESGSLGALLFVADAGPGVPAEDREKIFEPFYTTKAPGRGTGLGLAIVQRTVHDMGGLVWVDAAREGGAAFKIFLPEAAD